MRSKKKKSPKIIGLVAAYGPVDSVTGGNHGCFLQLDTKTLHYNDATQTGGDTEDVRKQLHICMSMITSDDGATQHDGTTTAAANDTRTAEMMSYIAPVRNVA